jgi:putative PEP-CTERM system histidine kinase
LDFENISPDWYLSPGVWSYGLAALGFSAFAIQLSVGWKGGGRAVLLLAAVTLSAFWAAATTAFALSPSGALWRTTHVFDSLRLVCAAAFLAVILLRPHNDLPAISVQRRLSVWVFASILSLAGAALTLGMPLPGISVIESERPTLIFGAHLALSLVGLVLAEQVYRHSPATLRWHVRPLCIGLAGPFALDVVVYSDALLFRTLDLHFWAARGFAHALAIPLLGLAARRNRDWTFDVTVSRSVIAGSTAVLAAGVYLLAVAGSGYYVRYFGGTWGKTLQTVVFFGAFLFLGFVTVSSTFRAKVRVLVAKNFFSYRYDYREEWLKFTRTLSASEETQPVEEVCVRALADLVESTGGGLWLKRDQPPGYAQVTRFSQPRVEAVESVDGALASFLARSGWVIEVPLARRDPTSQGAFGLPAWLDQLHDAWLVVPLLFGDDLIGFVVLEQPRVKMEVNWEVRDLLKTAGRQAASYLAMKQATEALLEARKFDAFNRMSAFVVHDLKNLVAQLRLMLRNAEKHHANPDFQRDMLETVEHVVERMGKLMQQLRSGETPVEGRRPLDLGALVRRVQATRAPGQKGLKLNTAPEVLALGHEDRLERVIGHLIQNGFDAAGENARVDVRVFRDAERAVIEVADNGIGMSKEFVRDELFKPFKTTKTSGMGIGAYESQQYVMSLGGRIEVQSEPGVGTRVQVILPALEQAGAASVQEQPA